jgi:prepilin-type N-terminal cleavage/methylation domain-containing protein
MKARRGYTLVELIIVLGLLAVIGTVSTRIYFDVTSEWVEQRRRADLNDRADDVFESLRKDLARMVAPGLTDHALEGERATYEARQGDEDRPYWNLPLADDRLGFPVRQGNRDAVEGVPVVAARYAVDRSARIPALFVRYAAYGGPADAGAPKRLAEGVLQCRIEYLPEGGEAEWQPGWEALNPPVAVRMTLVLQDADNPARQTVRQAVLRVPVGD